MFLSWIHVILSEQLYDREFVSRWTNGPLLVRLDTGRLLREGDVVEGGDARDFLPFPLHRRPARTANADGVGHRRAAQ